MFLCLDCHKKTDCKNKQLEEIPFGMSYGKCEDCGATKPCVDCHGYGSQVHNGEQLVNEIVDEVVLLNETPTSTYKVFRELYLRALVKLSKESGGELRFDANDLRLAGQEGALHVAAEGDEIVFTWKKKPEGAVGVLSYRELD
jgi:hypothetical protein